jgi:hypothetical protein
VLASTVRATVSPDTSRAQSQKILQALTLAGNTLDASRSDLDELDVAVRVIEHLRPLDERGLADVPRSALDKLAQRADAMRSRAPFRVKAPEGKSERDATLRRYLASFGIDSPPKTTSERHATGETLVTSLTNLAKGKPRPSIVHILAGSPELQTQPTLAQAVRRLRRLGTLIAWSLPTFEPSLAPPWRKPKLVDEELEVASDEPPFDAIAPHAAAAVQIRAAVAQRKSEAALLKMGVRVQRVKPAQLAASRAIETTPELAPAPPSDVGDGR